jgi:hypothetical protein
MTDTANERTPEESSELMRLRHRVSRLRSALDQAHKELSRRQQSVRLAEANAARWERKARELEAAVRGESAGQEHRA